MTSKAHTGSELAEMVLKSMVIKRWYLGSEVYELLVDSGWLNAEDFALHRGKTETKSYRRTQNALRDLSAKGLLERNKFSSNSYQYRMPK